METFCQGDQIWDPTQLWNITLPIFNRCFQRTLPIYIPALFLWSLGPFQLYLILRGPSSGSSIPYNLYNVSRLLFVLMIIAVNAVQFGYDLRYYVKPDPWHAPSPADLTGSIVNVFTFTLFAFLLFLHRFYGIHTSGLAWLFTFFSLMFTLPTLYMYAFFYGNPDVLSDAFKTGIRSWDPIELALFAAHFGFLLIVFLLTCFADQKPSGGYSKSQNGSLQKPLMGRRDSVEPLADCPELKASFLSYLSYWWFNSLAITGFKKSLTLADLWQLNPEDTTAHIAPRFDRAWLSQIKYSKEEQVRYAKTAASNGVASEKQQNLENFVDQAKGKRKPGTFRAMFGTFGWYFATAAAYKLIHDLLIFANPQLLKIFITFISSPDSPTWHGFFIASLFFLTAMTQSFIINYYFHIIYSIGMRIRTALISAIYRKSLTLSNDTRRETTTGEIQNLMSVDVQKFADLIPYVNLLWSVPLQICLTMYFLWMELGPSVLAGTAVLVLMIPINGWVSSFQRKLQIKQMERKDERVKVINEVLNGIKVIKLYGYELPFIGKISRIRSSEISQLQKISLINAHQSIMWTCSPFLVSFVTFAVYVLSSSDHVLDAKKAFVSLSLFELLRFPLAMLPETITSVVMASVSIKRLNRFLNSKQLEKYVGREEATDAVIVENGFFSWTAMKSEVEKSNTVEEEKLVQNGISKVTLSGIDLKVPKGSLVAIVGNVGSGKSSLLSAILGDMERIDGKVNVAKGETVAYVSQQAWIRNATLRENILFGADFVKARYDSIIEMCALKPDLAILPGGDQTEIGEKGINLSGGQKQRVAIARACYQPASIVLLDDPLSAVDSHVARHIFQQVLSSTTGYLRDRTRILVTNNITVLPDVDNIIVLSHGSISETGTYDQLIANSGKFSDFIREHANAKDSDPEDDADAEPSSMRRRTRTISTSSDKTNSTVHQTSILDQTDDKLIEAERAETGNVKWSVYMDYFRSLTCFWIVIIVIGYVGMQIASVGSNVWLAVWSSDVREAGLNGTESKVDTAQRNYRLGVYGGLGLAQGILFFLGSIALVKGTINSSITLHRSLLDRIMRSPISFFDTTPLGRILNRFSKEFDCVDSHIPYSIDGFLICLLQVVATFILISVQLPIFIVVEIPILLLYLFIEKFYVATSRQLKRLESVTRSPIYSHFSETLQGVSTIRAFNVTHRFIVESNHLVDTNQRCYFPSFIANRWLSLRLEFCGNLIVLFTALFSVWYRDSFTSAPGFSALIITYSLSVTDVLNWCVRMSSEVETNVVSVERISEYCQLPTEADWTRQSNNSPKVPDGWPQKGELTFVDYSVRYRDGLPLVLSGIDVKVAPGEKVGIVGRTGAGKSSLTLALFRLLEPAGGRIFIDDVDITRIGLHELRLKLSIIPQDPVLFSGTIRTNLDPFNVYTDKQLWRALENCHLKDFIASDETGLDYPIAENGSNLSVGQRQLVCLGRALLRRTRILVLDEATAAIDLETDSIIQQTIRREFTHCTVLTIAHRLATILDSDRVMVFADGKVVEFDSPYNLLANTKSQFYSLAKDARLV